MNHQYLQIKHLRRLTIMKPEIPKSCLLYFLATKEPKCYVVEVSRGTCNFTRRKLTIQSVIERDIDYR